MAISDDQGPTTLGVALNYVGRDDGILLRALNLPVPAALKSRADDAAIGRAAASLLKEPLFAEAQGLNNTKIQCPEEGLPRGLT